MMRSRASHREMLMARRTPRGIPRAIDPTTACGCPDLAASLFIFVAFRGHKSALIGQHRRVDHAAKAVLKQQFAAT
jgi:hypothetical protein